jgi:hypothetical protein
MQDIVNAANAELIKVWFVDVFPTGTPLDCSVVVSNVEALCAPLSLYRSPWL